MGMVPKTRAVRRAASGVPANGERTGRKAVRPGSAQGAPARPQKKEPTAHDLLKLEIAEELGLGQKVRSEGWAMLTAAESGRLGGILNQRLKERGLIIGPKGTLLRAN